MPPSRRRKRGDPAWLRARGAPSNSIPTDEIPGPCVNDDSDGGKRVRIGQFHSPQSESVTVPATIKLIANDGKSTGQ